MNINTIKSSQISYTFYEQISKNNEANEIVIKLLTKNNHSSLKFATWSFPVIAQDSFKDARAILLSQSGAFKDDDMLDELLANIYKARGRSETE